MGAARSPNRLKASIVDLTFIVWAAVVPTLFRSRLFSSDGDFARHLRMGRRILEHGPYQIDDLAYTHSGPFVTTEWLSQLAYALAHRLGGLAGDAILVGIIIGLAYALVVLFLRRCGVDPFLAYFAGVIAGVLGAPHWVARPHLFTFLALSILLHLALAGRARRLWVFAPFFLVWANFHGGFVLGLAILGALAAGELIEAWTAPSGSAERKNWLGLARFHGLAIVIGTLASAVNPMGPDLLLRIVRVLGNGYLLQNTAEFQSPNFHSVYGRALIVVFSLTIAVLAVRPQRPSWPRLAVILMLLAGSLMSARNAPLFGMVAIPLLAVEMDSAWKGLGARWIAHLRTVFEEGERIAVRGRWAPWFAVLLVLLGLNHGSIAGTTVVTNSFDPREIPVTAVRQARLAGLQGRIFNNFTWGGYMLLEWPEQRIFIDGMTDFLGNDVMKSYMKITALDPGWEEELRGWDVSVVLMPPSSRLIAELRRRGGWSTWYEDDVATILTRGEPVLEPATDSP
jgi:hypothetical protein